MGRSSVSVGAGLSLAMAVLASGCGAGLVAAAHIETPARVPVRAFPRIIVVAADALESPGAADALARHLSGDDSDVRRMSAEDVAREREAGAIARATVVLRVELQLGLQEPLRLRPPRRPPCGFAGCLDPPPSGPNRVEQVLGRLVLRVSDGPSGRTLQREILEDDELGDDALGGRLRVSARLLERARALLDQRNEPVRVRLLPAPSPAGRAALDLLVAGDWAGGRRALEAIAQSEEFAAFSSSERAYLLYDLGQARRFDDSVPPDRRLELAREAFREALGLARDPRVAAAMRDLETQARAQRDIRAQSAARSHNFTVGGEGPTVPRPPRSYSDSAED